MIPLLYRIFNRAADLALSLGHPTPNLPELMRSGARQPERSRLTLNKRVAQAFSTEMRP